MELRDKISAFIRENMAIIDGHAVLNDSDNIFELGFVDSMFAMQLVCFVESEFDIKVDNEDLDINNFNSVHNIVMFLERKQPM
jgi:acyl carrier protein